MNYYLRPCYILLFFLLSPLTVAETVKVITVDWPPFYARDLPGNGFVTEIAREAFKRKGHTLDITFAPLKRAKHLTRKGEFHGLFGCWINDISRSHYNISKAKLASGDGHFLALQGSNLRGLQSDDLTGKRIGIVRGYGVSDKLQAMFDSGEATRVEVSRIKQLLNMIQLKGRIDLILENELVAEYEFKKSYPGRKYNLETVGKDDIDGGLYICWSKNNEAADKFRPVFDEAIKEMHSDGTLQKIKSQFYLSHIQRTLNGAPQEEENARISTRLDIAQ